MEIISSKRRRARLCRLPERRRRRRISITAGEESEANGTCGSNASLYDVLEEGEHKQIAHRPHMFALFEDDLTSSMGPQASQPSAAQPAVMDIRRLRRRLLDIHCLIALTSGKVERVDACLRFSNWGFVQSFSHLFSLFSFHVTSK